MSREKAEAYKNLGNEFLELSQLNEAIEQYNLAINEDPTYRSAYSNKANVLESSKQLKEAIEVYDQMIKLNP